MTTALITGASAGLGWAFAEHLAGEGYDLVLVARDRDRLEERAAELGARHPGGVEVLAADLSRLAGDEPGTPGLSTVAARLRDPRRPSDLLVNNAGFGLNRSFADSELEDQLRLLDVLCRAIVVLSHAAVPGMTERGRGAILNVSSVAGFAALGTYSAAKAWVTTFSRSLAAELAGSGVRVCALCPGLIHTEFHARATMNMSRVPRLGWLDAQDVVRIGLADLRRGRVVSVPSLRYKALVAGLGLLPGSLTRAGSARINRSRRG